MAPENEPGSSLKSATIEESSPPSEAALPSPIPPPVPVETHPNRIRPLPKSPDPSRLAPEDALTPPRLRSFVPSLDGAALSASTSAAARAAAAALRPAVASLRQPPAIPPVAARLEQERRAARAARKRSRQPHVWKRLLWVKQKGYPDNYTDPATFLDKLERPKLRPYEFWPLVADSMVIVQHVAALLVFVCAYAGIYQDRLSPVAVVVCGSFATVIAWVMWDQWKCEEDTEEQSPVPHDHATPVNSVDSDVPYSNGTARSNPGLISVPSNGEVNINGIAKKGFGLSLSTSNLHAKNVENGTASHHGPSLSKSSMQSISPIDPLMEQAALPSLGDLDTSFGRFTSHRPSPSTGSYYVPHSPTTLPQSVSPRNQARIKTLKSAILIYFALLGLSPILKSLTKSTSSDSIWALATWLLIINIFFFDYGSQYIPAKVSSLTLSPSIPQTPAISSTPDLRPKASHASIATVASSRMPLSEIGTGPDKSLTDGSAAAATLPPQNPYPSSLATNAALMASTVLASRLSTTTAVFSLTLFSIQIFGLFPLFRRYLRSRSFQLHTLLTFALVVLASAGLGLILSQSYTHTHGDCGFCLSWCFHVFLKSLVGIVLGSTTTMITMGGCAWWLISLQRYKNVVIGPWDPAKPMLAGGGRVEK